MTPRHTKTIEEQINEILPVLRSGERKKEITEIFSTIVCVEQATTPSNVTIISIFKTKGVGNLNCVDLRDMTYKASHKCLGVTIRVDGAPKVNL